MMVDINKERCIGCQKCIGDCVSFSLYLEGGKACYTGECINCGHCVAICPVNAVAIPEYDMADVTPVIPPDEGLQIETVLGAIKARRSIRHYTKKEVANEKLSNIIQAARYTATGINLQDSKFIIVKEKLAILNELVWETVEQSVKSGAPEGEPFERLLKMKKQKQIDYLFRNAPVVIYIATDRLWDAGLAAQNMELAAVSQGLGVLYNGFLLRATAMSKACQDFLELDGKQLAVSMLLGYPAMHYVRTAPRKKADALWL